MKKATIIIPTYNERDNISPTVEALQQVFKKITKWDMSILVVDDTSPDKTYEVVKKMQKSQKNLHLLINKKKAGLGGAYLKGMEYAFDKLKQDVIFEFDADLSHDPEKIPQFLAKIDQGFDMVLGSRYSKGGSMPKDWGIHRKLLSVAGNLFTMIVLTDFSIHDWTGGYRAIRKKVYDAIHPELASERFSGYTFQIGFLHKAVRKGFKITEVPFHFKDRTIGKSKMGPEYIKNSLIYITKVRAIEILKNRIFKFLVVGTVGALTQLIMANILPNVIKFEQFPLNILPDFLAIEIAVLSNFILSNMWTFADRKLKPNQYLVKFLQFNLASGGSIGIQTVLIGAGIKLFGLVDLFKLPLIGFMLNSRTVYHATGIIIGMFWNFFAYSKIVWKDKKK
jgi:dolichol-phosphate mannosyltransferase